MVFENAAVSWLTRGEQPLSPFLHTYDVNLSPRWVDALADAGIESAHWSAIGSLTGLGPEIMAFAQMHGYVVLTHDLDFGSIRVATHRDKPRSWADPRPTASSGTQVEQPC